MRLSAKAVFDTRPELVAKAFELAPMLKDIYGSANGPQPAIFYADQAEADFVDMQRNNETAKF